MKRFYSKLTNDPIWPRIISFSLVLFFVFLGDGILSFWVPNLLQDSLKSPILMGFVMSFSSLVGFLIDFFVPQIVSTVTVKKFLMTGIFTGVIFAITLLISLKMPLILIFLIAMAVWGIYYELFGFASQQFMADTLPLKMRTGGWAIYEVFKNLAYFLGPLIAAWLIVKSEWYAAIVSIFFTLVGFGILVLIKKIHDRPFTINIKNVNLLSEFKHWGTLLEYVWPVITLSLVLGIIDATFWTTGTVWTEELTRQSFFGSFFLSVYQLPSLFIGLIITKLNIVKGKKRLAMSSILIAGVFLSLLGYLDSVHLIIFITFLASILLSAAFPLIDGIYTDIIARMGAKREHMIGLSGSTISLAYIIGPILSGFLANFVGEGKTFSVVGIMAVFVALILLSITPRKIKLPQTEINKWDNIV